MKFIIDCKSLLLQNALEKFLKDYLTDYDGLVISDEIFGDIVIGKDIKKPFSRSQLLLQLERIWQNRDKEREKNRERKRKKEPKRIEKKFDIEDLVGDLVNDLDDDFDNNQNNDNKSSNNNFDDSNDDLIDIDIFDDLMEKETNKRNDNFERKLDFLVDEFSSKLKKLIKEEYGKKQYSNNRWET